TGRHRVPAAGNAGAVRGHLVPGGRLATGTAVRGALVACRFGVRARPGVRRAAGRLPVRVGRELRRISVERERVGPSGPGRTGGAGAGAAAAGAAGVRDVGRGARIRPAGTRGVGLGGRVIGPGAGRRDVAGRRQQLVGRGGLHGCAGPSVVLVLGQPAPRGRVQQLVLDPLAGGFVHLRRGSAHITHVSHAAILPRARATDNRAGPPPDPESVAPWSHPDRPWSDAEQVGGGPLTDGPPGCPA